MFDRNLGGPDAWGEAWKLIAPDAAAGDEFGASVAVEGDLIAVDFVFPPMKASSLLNTGMLLPC